MFKKLTISFLVLLLLLILVLIAWVSRTNPVTASEQQVIDEVLSLPQDPGRLRVYHRKKGEHEEQGYISSAGTRIWYRAMSPLLAEKDVHEQKNPSHNKRLMGSVLLIHGMATSSAFWPDTIIDGLLAAGYQVIVSDHRGLGYSDWSSGEYDLSDLVRDNLRILDALGITQVHIIGLSMGGMIGQEIALQFPERVLSLISVMSSGFSADPDFYSSTTFELDSIRLLLRYGIAGHEKGFTQMMIGVHKLLGGKFPIDVNQVARSTLYELQQKRGFNHLVTQQHVDAIARSGSRYKRLPLLQPPVLVVHGTDDPVAPIAAAKKYAALIPAAETLWVKGMGHALAPEGLSQWLSASLTFIQRQAGR